MKATGEIYKGATSISKRTNSLLLHFVMCFPQFAHFHFSNMPCSRNFAIQIKNKMRTQQNFIQIKDAAFRFLLSAPLKQFYKRAFNMGNLLAFFVYASVRLMLHDFPFEILEETFFIVRILLAGWCLAALCIGSFTLLMFIADNNAKIRRMTAMKIIALYQACIQSIKAAQNERVVSPKRSAIESPEMLVRF